MITENYEISEKIYERFIRNNCGNCEKYVFTEDCELDLAFIDYFDEDNDKLYFNFNLKDWVGEEQLNLDSKCLHFEKENKDRPKDISRDFILKNCGGCEKYQDESCHIGNVLSRYQNKIPNKETLEAMRDIQSGENYETITLDEVENLIKNCELNEDNQCIHKSDFI